MYIATHACKHFLPFQPIHPTHPVIFAISVMLYVLEQTYFNGKCSCIAAQVICYQVPIIVPIVYAQTKTPKCDNILEQFDFR